MKYVQAVLLCLKDDEGPTKYFQNHREQISAVTGKNLVIAIPNSIIEGDAKDIVSAVNSTRYPGLKNADLPCLWIEDNAGAHFVLKLPETHNDIKNLIRVLTDAISSSQDLRQVEEAVMDKIKSPQPSSSSPPVPPWFAKAGAVFVGVTLLFFMSLIGASILQHDIPTNGKPLVVIVLALSIALSFAFIGGNAAAEGNVPLPFAKDKPVAFSVGGGIAAFVIVLLLGFGLYAK